MKAWIPACAGMTEGASPIEIARRRGLVRECVPLLGVAAREGLIKGDEHDELKADREEIAKMISGPINGLDKRGV